MSRHKSGGTGTRGASGLQASLLAFVFAAAFLSAVPATARDAAFLDPGSGSSTGAADDAIRVEPKNDIDVGESILNVARRVDLFFVNQSGQPVKVEKVSVNGDGNVASEVANDDCSKQSIIAPGSRCSVAVSITPSSPGAWSAQVLMTHDGAGRIARARLSGKTGGTAAGEKKDMGLALSTKEINPVNFGDIDIGGGKVVRSALMVNDSAEPITLYAIDVIEASNGLQRLEQGCAVDMELKPGESCPVTLVWTPGEPGQVSTDLIIRHSGRLGFAVVPIRGVAKGLAEPPTGKDGKSTGAGGGKGSIPPPPSATDLEKAANGKIQPVSAAALGRAANDALVSNSGSLTLIGTVGNRAVFVKPDGKTAVVSAGEEIELGDRQAKVTQVGLKSADIVIDGKKKTLMLETSAELVSKASLQASKTKDKEPAKEKEEIGTSAASSPPIPAMGASSAPSGGAPSFGGSSYGSSVSGAAK